MNLKRFQSLLVVLILLTALVPSTVSATSGSDITVVDLIAGQHFDAGDIKVWNDSDYLYVKYKASNYWCLDETHLQVASSLDDIPQKNGNPIPGQFEYQNTHNCASKFTYTIPLTKSTCDLYIAAHAVVEKSKFRHKYTETAWGSGLDFPGNNWATYFMYPVDGCDGGPNPNLSLIKDSSLDMSVIEPDDQADAGDVINYTLTATNDGNVILTNVTIADPLLDTLSCTPLQPATLAPSETVVCTGSYTLNQTDIINGSVENTATVTSEQTVPTTTSNSVPLLQASPHISLIKSTTATSYDQVGQIIDYTLIATNDGNVTLTDVSISDPLVGTLNCTQPVTLAPGETLTCIGSYTITLEDLDTGSFVNTAMVSGMDPDNQVVTDETSTTITTENICQPTVIVADFSQVAVGESVEGLGAVAPYLDIDAKGTAVKILEGTSPKGYGAPNDNVILNGGIAAGGGFSDVTSAAAVQAHQYTFTFAGITVSDFSLHMLDYGDWNPPRDTNHSVSLTAYDSNGTTVIQQEINYTTQAVTLPRDSSLYGDLYITGDAETASPGQLGNWTWNVSGSGIAKIVLDFGAGFDPDFGLDTLNFTTDCP